MTLRLGVVVDPISTFNIEKDSTIAILQACALRDFEIHIITLRDLAVRNGMALAEADCIDVHPTLPDWYSVKSREVQMLGELDLILMRKDPPFNLDYILCDLCP